MKKETTKKTKAELLEIIADLERRVEIQATTINGIGNRNIEKQKIIDKLEEENRLLRENAAPEPEEKPDTKEQMEALERIIQIRGDVIRALKDVVAMSCKDHCPHHSMPEACRNCGIKKKMLEIGAL